MKEVIIITSFFTFYKQVVYISDYFAFKEIVLYNSTPPLSNTSIIKDTVYQILDFENEVIHRISEDEKHKTSIELEYFNKYKVKTAFHIRRQPVVETKYKKLKLNGYKCNGRIESYTYRIQESTISIEKTYDHHYYFAESALLDSVLFSSDRFEFAGFEEQLDDPYKYLIYEFTSAPNDSNRVMKRVTVERGLMDTTLMTSLLKLPQAKG